jgi:hypothetical protein
VTGAIWICRYPGRRPASVSRVASARHAATGSAPGLRAESTLSTRTPSGPRKHQVVPTVRYVHPSGTATPNSPVRWYDQSGDIA